MLQKNDFAVDYKSDDSFLQNTNVTFCFWETTIRLIACAANCNLKLVLIIETFSAKISQSQFVWNRIAIIFVKPHHAV